jgi:ribosome-associated heat shock protein Hsp15
VRIDKYLWTIRLYKTRSLATKACTAGHVKIDDSEVKPSRNLNTGETIEVRKLPIWRKYEILGFPKSRVGAKLLPEYMKETTDAEQLEHYDMMLLQKKDERPKGDGRPTKRDRRDMDNMLDW